MEQANTGPSYSIMGQFDPLNIPGSRYGHVMLVDERSGALLLFGGTGAGNETLLDPQATGTHSDPFANIFL